MKNTTSRRRAAQTAAAILATASLAACGMGPKPRAAKSIDNGLEHLRPNLYPTLRGTIADYALLIDSAPLRVEGYGVVAELPGTGSGDMPPTVREILLGMLYKAGANSYQRGTQDISPERILQSNEIAAVEVHGMIPPMARRGDSFDLFVNCLSNSQATSLSGGLLWTSELKIVGLTADTMLDTKTIALGRGPVFLPGPVVALAGDSDAARPANMRRAVREGRIIGGGRVNEDRDVRLELFSPSAGMCMAIERAINSRFPGRDKAADAQNDSIIELHVPPEFQSDPAQFVDIVMHMYLRQEAPGFSDEKARELLAALQDPAAPLRDISLALQGLGRSTLPDFVQPQYLNPDPKVRFWCARAGAGLQDVSGMVVLQQFADDPASPFQKDAVAAIGELSRGDTDRATMTLMEQLKSKNLPDRITAYQGLVAINSHAVTSFGVGRKFVMDVVIADCPPTIYVSQTGMARIALLGPMMNAGPGLVYISSDHALTLSVPEDAGDDKAGDDKTDAAPSGDATVLTASAQGGQAADAAPPAKPAPLKNNVTLYYVPPGGERASVEVKTTVRLPDIIARLGWIPDPRLPPDPATPFIGASYQRIAEMLASMCKDQLIDAQFVLQKAPPRMAIPADIVNSSRPEGSTQMDSPPTATRPAAPATNAPTAPNMPASTIPAPPPAP